MKSIVEICCGSYSDALAAWKAGATRIELNSALSLGGLTPSLATLKMTKQNTGLKVITMIRPRGAGFCYDEEDCCSCSGCNDGTVPDRLRRQQARGELHR